MKLDAQRREYKFAGLNEREIEKNPYALFSKWMTQALNAGLPDATAMSLVTFGTDGFPQTRIVLLKDFGEKGFTFFSNYTSEKGKAISLNNKVGLHFFWPDHERQIRISGFAEKTSTEISDTYFKSRPLESRIAAIASEQSSTIESRNELELRYNQVKNNGEYKRPSTWGGYLVSPVRIEFWQGGENRLHDRILYSLQEGGWKISRLSP